MKKILLCLFILTLPFLLASCFKTNYKFPNNYHNSIWYYEDDSLSIEMAVDDIGNTNTQISFEGETKTYETAFKVEMVNFYLINENNDYILENGETISPEEYKNNIDKMSSSPICISFVAEETTKKSFKMYILEKNYLKYFKNEISDSDKKISFDLSRKVED